MKTNDCLTGGFLVNGQPIKPKMKKLNFRPDSILPIDPGLNAGVVI